MTDREFIRLGVDRFDEFAALHRAYKAEIGEDAPTQSDLESLRNVMTDGKIYFFGCVCDGRLTACCSVCRIYSTFNYAASSVFEDLYILPEWRHRGIARRLTESAYAGSGVESMTVGCADCDRDMYMAIGFDMPLGNMLAYAPQDTK